MTALEKAQQSSIAPPGAATSRGLAAEFADTLRLAMPMALTQLGQIVMMTTDLALIGRLGAEAVAAAALANAVYFVCFTVGMGVIAAVAPLAALAYGARDPHRLRRAVRAGFWAALLISLPMMAFPIYGEQILRALGQAEAPSILAQQYLFGLVLGATPALWLLVIRGFMGALNRPEPVLWITLAAIPANALLVWLFIHGAWGLPRLGLFGAGLAHTLVNFAMLLAGLWFVIFRRPFAKYHLLGHLWRIDRSTLRQLFAIGAPISIALVMEYGLFTAAAFLAGLIGTVALAAHQIALQVTAILFMVPLGIGMAATVRVGHAAGRRDAEGVRRAGLAAAWLGILLGAGLTLLVVAGRFAIAGFFLGQTPGTADATLELAATLLLVGASFFVTDGLQTILAGSLRGLKDTRIPLLFSVVSYWLVGFPAAWMLAFPFHLGAVGVWIGLSLGTLVYATCLVLRFRLLTNRFGTA